MLGSGFHAQPVRVPPELQNTRATALEEYVRARLNQFAMSFAQRVAPRLTPEEYDRSVAETYTQLPPPEYGAISVENRELQLVFRHDCLALGCTDMQCALCQHNPHRRCRVNFDRKYLVQDTLRAKCNATIRVELIDRATGQLFEEEMPELQIEMDILDGNQYDQRFLDGKPESDSGDLASCSLLMNNKNQPLLVSMGGGAVNMQSGRVVMSLTKGKANLPDLHVTDSSEALLSGRKPPFRLLVAAAHKGGRKLRIRHAVSEGFVVATRRTRTAGKVEIPSVDDHISKLEHMGKETVKKLQDLRSAAECAQISLALPEGVPNRIQKVGEFRWLAQAADQDGHLRQKLQQVLKLSKEKWEEARDHAMKSVVADNRMRAWYSDRHGHEVGLLFTCRLGSIDLERPVALLHKLAHSGQTSIEATLMAQLTPEQRELVRGLQQHAVSFWWHPTHPGWSLCPYDSEKFLQTGSLAPVAQLPNVPAMPLEDSPRDANPPPRHPDVDMHSGRPPRPTTGSLHLQNQGIQFGGAGGSGGSQPRAAVAVEVFGPSTTSPVVFHAEPGRAMPTDSALPPNSPFVGVAQFSMEKQKQSQQGRPAAAPQPGPPVAPPSAGQAAGHSGQGFSAVQFPGTPNSLQGLLNQMNSCSIPVIPSIELDALLQGQDPQTSLEQQQQTVFFSPTAPPVAKVESLELPDSVPDSVLQFEPGMLFGGSGRQGRNALVSTGREQSLGLDSMQSIEQSLDDVQKTLGEEAAGYLTAARGQDSAMMGSGMRMGR
eukprot:evm.model.scf_324.1 EVM.evm.TU.scf_324.1   scf_324:1593-3902(+)